VSSNWGGTVVQAWSSPDALKACNESMEASEELAISSEQTRANVSPHVNPNANSVLWNALIVPLLPMRLRGAIWYQGESNVGQWGGAPMYRCAFPAMIHDWRVKLGLRAAQFPFFFVQLAPYPAGGTSALADIRLAQTAALSLPFVGMGTAVDLGDMASPSGNIHPRDKQDVSRRLFHSAAGIAFNATVLYTGPLVTSVTATSNFPNAVVQLQFDPTSLGNGLVLKQATCPTGVTCAGFEIQSADKAWHVVSTVAILGNAVNLQSYASANLGVLGVRYGYADWPLITVYNSVGLPTTPFILPVN